MVVNRPIPTTECRPPATTAPRRARVLHLFRISRTPMIPFKPGRRIGRSTAMTTAVCRNRHAAVFSLTANQLKTLFCWPFDGVHRV